MTKQFIVLSLAFSTILTSVMAQSPSPKGMRAELVADRCEKVTANVNGVVTSANARIEARTKFVNTWKTNVANRITKLKDRGADVTKLNTDATQLGTFLDTWLADYKTYISDLQAAQQFSCGTSQGQFKTALQTARTAHKKVLADRKALMDFIRMTLQPDFKALKSNP